MLACLALPSRAAADDRPTIWTAEQRDARGVRRHTGQLTAHRPRAGGDATAVRGWVVHQHARLKENGRPTLKEHARTHVDLRLDEEGRVVGHYRWISPFAEVLVRNQATADGRYFRTITTTAMDPLEVAQRRLDLRRAGITLRGPTLSDPSIGHVQSELVFRLDGQGGAEMDYDRSRFQILSVDPDGRGRERQGVAQFAPRQEAILSAAMRALKRDLTRGGDYLPTPEELWQGATKSGPGH